jgi:serine/threonine protein phosphatase PrpC
MTVYRKEHEKPKFVVRRGIVGKHAPTPVITENVWYKGDILALHSDGISTRWDWHDFAVHANSPAQVIAEEIFNVAEQDHDDATIVIVK